MQAVVDSDCDGHGDCGTWEKALMEEWNCGGQIVPMMAGFTMEPVRDAWSLINRLIQAAMDGDCDR